MQKKRPLTTLIAALFGLLACIDASALGFGRAPQTAVLGQPLDFVVPLRLDPGEVLTAECLSAEVTVGDSRVPPYLVRALLEPQGAESALVRVVTTPSVDEPVVAVTITAGCAARMSRRFLLLADPPLNSPALAVEPGFAPVAVMTAAAAPRSPPPPPRPSSSVAKAAPPSRPSPKPAPGANTPLAAKPRATAKSVRKAAPAPTAAPAAESTPRLKLDPAESMPLPGAPLAAAALVEEAIAAVAEAASAARASALAASAAAQRISALEQNVTALRADAQASRDAAARWSKPLLLAVGLLAVLVGWLLWRLRALQQADRRDWLRAATAASVANGPATAPIPLVNSELALPALAPRPAWPMPMAVPALCRCRRRWQRRKKRPPSMCSSSPLKRAACGTVTNA